MKELSKEEIQSDLIKKLLEINDLLPLPGGVDELKFIENAFLPDNVVVISTKIFNQLKNEFK